MHDRRQRDGGISRRHPRRPADLVIAFMLAGAIAGLAGWLLAIRTSGATANLGIGMLFNAFAAVVIGGVSLKGGVGSAARRLCRRAAALLDPHRDQPDGPAGPLHPGDPRPAGAGRRTPRYAQADASGRNSHEPEGSTSKAARAHRRRRARHRQGDRRALRRRGRPAGRSPTARPTSGRPTADALGRRLRRHRHLATKPTPKAAVAAAVERLRPARHHRPECRHLSLAR